MKKLRLLVTEKCTRDCEGCCNKDIKPTYVVSRDAVGLQNYHYILITGGEPLLFPNQLINFMTKLSRKPTRILYTAIFPESIEQYYKEIYTLFDGITFTIHDSRGVQDFIRLQTSLKIMSNTIRYKRLNIFCNVFLPPMNLYEWNVKFIDWIKSCPLPEDENFAKLDELW